MPKTTIRTLELDMSLAISIVLTVILIALIIMSRRDKAASGNRQPPASRINLQETGSQFHAVSIQAKGTACAAAMALADKRFLSGAAPRIPLADCDRSVCKCRFIHHKDRRSGEDRRGQAQQTGLGATGGYSGKERRFRGDRRGANEPQNLFS